MKTEFEQKRGVNTRKFTLTAEKVIVETKTLRKIDRYEIKLDRLGLDIHYRADNTVPGKILLGVWIFIIVGLTIEHFTTRTIKNGTLFLNYFMFSILACISYFKQHQDDIYLVGGETTLVFYRNIPNETKVLDFIDVVRSEIKNVWKTKYTLVDEETTRPDFYGRINWLREKGIIDNDEYIELKTNFDTESLL